MELFCCSYENCLGRYFHPPVLILLQIWNNISYTGADVLHPYLDYIRSVSGTRSLNIRFAKFYD
jgi:hypothetical protein